jgi:hypothetical protein
MVLSCYYIAKVFSTALSFPFGQRKLRSSTEAKDGPDWARTSDPALIKRML